MSVTSTASLGIGFRRGWSEWQKSLPGVISWAKANHFAAIDVGPLPRAELETITKAGLKIGTIDLIGPWSDLASSDAGKRKAMADKTISYIASVVDLCSNFFTVIIPEDHAKPRHENFKLAVDGYSQLCAGMNQHKASLVIEGYPGGAPYVSSLACTPADYRAFFKEMPGAAAAINFDPSHLVRMGIDPVRFLGEFAPKVRHVHGKDTEIMPEDVYEHGYSQPATFAPSHGFGGTYWRYTIPGHGQIRWTKCFQLLEQAGYKGLVCIELEDARFNGTEAGEKRGLTAGREFLTSV
jgi:sugar phosphate isomerase/epimerase